MFVIWTFIQRSESVTQTSAFYVHLTCKAYPIFFRFLNESFNVIFFCFFNIRNGPFINGIFQTSGKRISWTFMWWIEERCINVKSRSFSSRSVAVGLVARFYIYCILSSIPFSINLIFPLVCLFQSFIVFLLLFRTYDFI